MSRSVPGRLICVRRSETSIVELPDNLPPGAWDSLRSTRISGQLIELSKLGEGGSRGGYIKKPRSKDRR